MPRSALVSLIWLAGCTVPYEEVDTDGDGLMDFVDNDDDGDGFTDAVEFKCDGYGGDSKSADDKPEAPEASETDDEAVACRTALTGLIRCDTVTSPDGKHQGEACTVPEQTGSCALGAYVCQQGAGGATLVCTPNMIGQVEVCDGIDNDCDKVVDNIVETQCATGNPGLCATGVRKCVNNAESCVGTEPNTVTEICDGLDNDCDGPADDMIPGDGEECQTGLPGNCATGRNTCMGAAGTSCVPVNQTQEVCDGIDNDCDGTKDNRIELVGTFCMSENQQLRGECRKGNWQCTGTPTPSLVCVTNEPTTEVCGNGLDEDCSGTADDGEGCGCVDGDGDGYGTGGGCLGADCDDTNRSIHPGQPDVECNGIDDNCAGGRDEGFVAGNCEAEATGQCAQGRLACSDAGVVSCVAGTPALSESCNGLDDDCDGRDDTQPGEVNDAQVGQACSSNNQGECRPGTLVCTGGNPPIVCRSNIQPNERVEACDGLDNDCDGDTDETFSPACDGQTWGESCNSSGLRCSRGLFCASLQVGSSEGTCLKICTTGADCLSGQACQPVAGQRICVSLCDPGMAGSCPAGQLCSADGFCVPVPCGTAGSCPGAAPTCTPQGYCEP